MWLTLRNTLRRGRSFVPAIRLRCRRWMRTRRSTFVLIFMANPKSQIPNPESLSLRSCLACLLLQHLAGVPDALLLVGIRFAQAADVRRHLPDELPVDAGD